MTCAAHLVDDLRVARAELVATCASAPDESLRVKPSNDAWAPIEVLAHIVDVDRFYLSEARAIRDEPGRVFAYFDDETWKSANADAAGREPRDVRLAMAFAQDEVLRWARSLTPEELDIAGGHPRRGSITVREILQRIPAHDRRHAEQICTALSA